MGEAYNLGMKWELKRIKNIILDADGVLWRGETALPALPAFFETLQQLKLNYVIATNNSTKSVTTYVKKFAGFGVQMPASKIITSATATASWLAQRYPPKTPLFVVGEAGLQETLTQKGFEILSGEPQGMPAAVVVVGLTRGINYQLMSDACLHLAAGAAFVGSNPDASLPTEKGDLPGAGAIIAALEAASGVQADPIIGKPNAPMFAEALNQLGALPQNTAMVGDRLETDIAGALHAGIAAILVLSGISKESQLTDTPYPPHFVFPDIHHLGRALAGESAKIMR